MASTEISKNFKLMNPYSLDAWYGPYNSLAEANAAVPAAARGGRTVGVITNGVIAEYIWHPGNLTDAGLSVKTGPIGPAGPSIATWTATTYSLNAVVNYLGKDWYANAATLSTDVPGTSSKWVNRLAGYSPVITEVGKNLFNINALDNEPGFYINADNFKGANAGYYLTGFIPVKISTWYYPSVMDRVVYYDSNKVYISGTDSSRGVNKFQTPANAAYARLSRAQNPPVNFQLEEGQVATTYEAYKETVKLISLPQIPSFLLATASVTNQKITDKAVSSKKVDFLQTGKNIYNYNDEDVVKGVYFSTAAGATGVQVAYSITGFIPVTVGKTYFCNKNLGGGGYNLIYDINKTVIGSFSTASILIPANAVYIRYSINCTDAVLQTVQIEEGSAASTFEAFSYIMLPPSGAPIKADGLTSAGITQVFANTPDKAIAREKTDFFEIGKNKFNKNATDVSLGKYILSSNGTPQPNAGYNSTGFIPVTAGLPYSYGPTAGGNQNAWYDSNKVYISGFSGATAVNVTAPVNATYARLSVLVASWDSFQFEQDIIQTAFKPYGLQLKGDTMDLSKNQSIQDTFSILLKNTISFPSKMHFLKGAENSIYFQAITKRTVPNVFYTRIAGTAVGSFDRSAKVTPATTGNIALTASLYDGDFNVIKTLSSTGVIGDPATNTTPVSLLAIGDSFTDAAVYLSRCLAVCPTLTLLGTNKKTKNSSPGLPTGVTTYSEGRSGWTLFQYINTPYAAAYAGFSPFLQPVAPYSYYGNTRTWKDTLAQTGTQVDEGFYSIAVAKGFSASTGYRTAPATNDVMYVDANSQYEVWNGSAWVAITAATLAFTFNFTKYRAVWGVAKPTIVSLMLGMNDFRFLTPTDTIAQFAAYKAQLDTVIASVFADGITKFAICLPLTAVGEMDNGGGNFTQMQNASLWEQRRLLIENYDNRTAEGIYIVDTGSSTDPVYGFDRTNDKPFAEYTGTATIPFTYNQPHPNADGYNQMGTRLAAFIQAVR